MNLSLLLLSSMFCVLTTEWLVLFLFMEINSFCFALMLIPKLNSTVKYFLIQGMGSIIILFSILLSLMTWSSVISWVLVWVGVILKMAVVPLFMWFPLVCSMINWTELFLILTWQKLIPIWLSFLINLSLLLLSSMFCVLVGGLLIINNSSSRLLIVFSSISFSGWLLISLVSSSVVLLVTFLTYLMMMFLLMKVLFLTSDLWYNSMKKSWKEKVLMMMFSLGGLPPMMGFVPKWLIVIYFTVLSMIVMLIFLILSLMNLFCYLKMFSILEISKETSNNSTFFFMYLNLFPIISMSFLLG